MRNFSLRLLFAFISIIPVAAQQEMGCEKIMKTLAALTEPMPANISLAYQFYLDKNAQLDSVQQQIMNEFPILADKINRRSAILNSFANYDNPNAVRYIIPANPKLNDFFMQQQDRMDNSERAYNKQVTSFYGKDQYAIKGYEAVWDSVYRSRVPAMKKYRDEVLKLVKADIDFLKANAAMFKSTNEAERMQYLEKQVTVLGRMQSLIDKFRRVVIDDGAKKVEKK